MQALDCRRDQVVWSGRPAFQASTDSRFAIVAAHQAPKIHAAESDIMNSVSHFRLENGSRVPQLGLGTWKIPKPRCAEVVVSAAEVGYRHFDCACDYGNELDVGQGLARVLREGTCQRDDLWITSKLWNTYHRPEHVRPACERSLRDLGLDALDLYLIHFPIALKFVPFDQRYPPGWFHDPSGAAPRMEYDPVPLRETWQAMEELVDAGLVKNIGICNFNIALIRDLMTYAAIRPAVLQVELHPYLTQEKLLRYCENERIAVTAFSPFGAQSYYSLNMADESESLLEHPEVQAIATETGRTPAQVLLRWAVQRGTLAIPKASSPEHLRENIAAFDFSLDEPQCARLSALNRNRRFNDPGDFCETAFNTFFPIYE